LKLLSVLTAEIVRKNSMPKLRNLAGMYFGRLFVFSHDESSKKGVRWWCICECGNKKSIASIGLLSGKIRSCGCLRRENTRKMKLTHGHSVNKKQSPEYRSYLKARSRCHDPKDKQYKDYGARGIFMCDEWRNSFENFIVDMGPKPNPRLTLERIDNEGPYVGWNCKWDTQKHQANNRRSSRLITFQNKTQTQQQWAEELGLNPHTLGARIRKGWPLERALSKKSYSNHRNSK
jgi:hypothetical protein